MAQQVHGTGFNSARLVRLLADPAGSDAPESKHALGERLGQWLDFKDAMSLFSALNADAAVVPQASAAASQGEITALRSALQRLRATLAGAISGTLSALPASADFAPYQRGHLAHQRDMTAKIGPLRARVRKVMSNHSTAMKRLAVLDAVFEQTLAARERDLLATLPDKLMRRFEALRNEAPAGDETWQTAFRQEMEHILLAELDLRLQPVTGLIAALDEQGTPRQ